VRRGTLITVIALFVVLVVAAIFQILAVAGKPHNRPGPIPTSTSPP